MAEKYDVIILGAGPAGLTAGMYLARARQKVVIINEGAVGGQTVLTHSIANYPGVEEIPGYRLAQVMKKQALTFGCRLESNTEITSFDFNNTIKTVITDDGDTFEAPAVIIATGGRPRGLGLDSEDRFRGQGISYCATCDGDFFQDQEIVVVGGGNSALEEAVSLTQFASKVTIVHMLDHFQAYSHAIAEAENNEKIDIITESVIDEFIGSESLEKVKIRNVNSGAVHDLAVTGAFIFIGYLPNTEKFNGTIELNSNGEIVAGDSLETSVPGVFAAGDVRQKRYRQITTAVADGTIAALSAIEHIQSLKSAVTA